METTNLAEQAKAALQKQGTAHEVGKVEQTKDTFRALLEERLPQIAEASLIKSVPPEYIVSEVLSCLRVNDKLRDCSPASVLHSALLGIQYGLRLNPVAGEAHLVPRRNQQGKWMAMFQPGYRGLLKLGRRNPRVIDLEVNHVRENDKFEFEFGSNKKLVHSYDPKLSAEKRGAVIGYYACVRLIGMGFEFVYWDTPKMLAFAKTYRSDKNRKNANGLWDGKPGEYEFDKMAFKTMLIQLSKMMPSDDPAMGSMAVLDELSRMNQEQGLKIDGGAIVHDVPDYKEPEPAVEAQPGSVDAGPTAQAQPEKPARRPRKPRSQKQ